MKKLLLIGILTMLLLVGTVSAIDDVAYYQFSDMSDQWNSYDATNQGTSSDNDYPTFNTSNSGSPNSSYFDGSDWIDIDTITYTENTSFSIWFKTDQSAVQRIIGFGADGQTSSRASVSLTAANEISYYDDIGNTGTTHNTGDFISAGVWEHLVLTFNSDGHVRIYHNSSLIEDMNTGDSLADLTSSNTILGGRVGIGTPPPITLFKGWMDEVQVFNKTLNTTEIENLFNYGNVSGATPPAIPDGGVYYFNFSDTTDLWGADQFVTNNGVTSKNEFPTFNISGDSSPNCFEWAGSNDKLNFTYTTYTTDWSVALWFKLDGNTQWVASNRRVSDGLGMSLRFDNSDNLLFDFDSGASSQAIDIDGGVDYTDDSWHLATIGRSGNNAFYSLDGEAISTTALSQTGTYDSGIGWFLGIKRDNNADFIGEMDNFMLFNRSLNQTEIENLYNYGNISGETPLAGGVTNFTVTVDDLWTGADVNNVSVLMTSGNESTGFSPEPIYQLEVKYTNLTIPAGYNDPRWHLVTGKVNNYYSIDDTCLDNGDSTLQLRYFYNATVDHVGQCYDGSSWVGTTAGSTTLGNWVSDEVYFGYFSGTNTTGNFINTTVLDNSTIDYNITVTSNGFYSRTYEDYNVNTSLSAELLKEYYTNESTFTITDYWDSTVLTNYTVNLTSYDYETELVDFTLTHTDYFPKTFTSYNTSTALTTTLYQAIIYFDTFEWVTGNEITGMDCTVNTTTQACNQSFNLTSGVYEVSVNKTPYYNKSFNVTISALDNKTINLTGIYNHLINLTVSEIITGATISNFTGWAYDEVNSYNYTFDTNGSSYFLIPSLQNNNYTLSVDKNGTIVTTDYNHTTDNTTLTNVTINAFTWNSVYIRFYDILTRTIINTSTIDFDLIGDYYSYNYSTSNGTIYATLLSPDSYYGRYTPNQTYAEGFYAFTLLNDDYENVSVYLINESLTTDITITVLDQDAKIVDGAYVKALRFDIATNSYLLQSVGLTNYEGQTIMPLTKNDEFYKFIVEYEGETVKTTSASYITSDDIVIQVNIGENAFETFFEYLSIDASLVFNPSTDNFRFTFNDVLGVAGEFCLKVFKVQPMGTTQVNSTCTTGASGTLLLGVTPENGTMYVGKAYYDGVFLIDAAYSYPDGTNFGKTGLFMQALLTLAFAGIALHNVRLVPVAIGASLLIGRFVHLHTIAWPSVIALFIVGFILTWVLDRAGREY